MAASNCLPEVLEGDDASGYDCATDRPARGYWSQCDKCAFRWVVTVDGPEIKRNLSEIEMTLVPNGRAVSNQPPHSFIIALPEGASALLDYIVDKGWQLTISQHGQATDRGLFRTPYDIQTLLEAEYFPHGR